jgi:hypothetical protein
MNRVSLSLRRACEWKSCKGVSVRNVHGTGLILPGDFSSRENSATVRGSEGLGPRTKLEFRYCDCPEAAQIAAVQRVELHAGWPAEQSGSSARPLVSGNNYARHSFGLGTRPAQNRASVSACSRRAVLGQLRPAPTGRRSPPGKQATAVWR